MPPIPQAVRNWVARIAPPIPGHPDLRRKVGSSEPLTRDECEALIGVFSAKTSDGSATAQATQFQRSVDSIHHTLDEPPLRTPQNDDYAGARAAMHGSHSSSADDGNKKRFWIALAAASVISMVGISLVTSGGDSRSQRPVAMFPHTLQTKCTGGSVVDLVFDSEAELADPSEYEAKRTEACKGQPAVIPENIPDSPIPRSLESVSDSSGSSSSSNDGVTELALRLMLVADGIEGASNLSDSQIQSMGESACRAAANSASGPEFAATLATSWDGPVSQLGSFLEFAGAAVGAYCPREADRLGM